MRIVGIVSLSLLLAGPALAQDDSAKNTKKLDLSTPTSGEKGKYGGGERAARPASTLGTMDLGGGQLRFDGKRNYKDAVQEATGHDQDPGSPTYRSLAPAAKSGTPPYVGFTLTTPTTR